ncbi:MAG: polyprenol monophosphomannose synthase [Candidatus Aminicenantes bacterium]|nr:polyprenol monophosphomannose synthase [Candidatus Aminicenantes bacterium]
MRIAQSVKWIAYEVREKTLIVIPTYNERENIVDLLTQIKEIVPGAHVVVVDDRSPDGTGDAVRSFCSAGGSTSVALIERTGARGLGNAYREGLRFGLDHGYDIMLTMDADFSHNPLHLPAILEASREHDVTIGSRYIRDGGTINWRIRRILLSWLANRFARFILNLKGADLTSGFRAYRRKILEDIKPEKIHSNGYSFLVEMLYRAQRKNARVVEVPILFFDRSMGVSKISRREIFLGILTILRLRCSRFRA